MIEDELRLECRFYSLDEISEILGRKNRDKLKRDVTHDLDLWGYQYDWKPRKGVLITRRPETPKECLTELIRRYLHIDTQIEPIAYAEFFFLLIVDDEFASMPWATRAETIQERCGIEITEKTLRNWARYLIREEYLSKNKAERTFWCTSSFEGQKVQFEIDPKGEDYLEYDKRKKELVQELMSKGLSRKEAYRSAILTLWERYHRCYYSCPKIEINGIYRDKLVEMVLAVLGIEG